MAYNFLGLVNDINKRVNEVPLTEVNFNSAVGFYDTAKNAVNSAIRQINHEQFEWPFNHNTQTETLVVGQTRYTLPATTKTVDYDTFRLKGNVTFNNATKKLSILSYEDYLEKFVDQEYNATPKTGSPLQVFRTPDMKFGVVPVPDNAYEVVFEYYNLPVDMTSATDIPTVPEMFRGVVEDGAMYYVYLFRGNTQDATVSEEKFRRGVEQMRTIYINRYEYVRDKRVR